MSRTLPANDLFHRLISEGVIRSGRPVAAGPDGRVSVAMPGVFCDQCASQLVTHWFVAGYPGPAPRLLCLWHAQDAVAHGDQTVQALIEGHETWLIDARCRCPGQDATGFDDIEPAEPGVHGCGGPLPCSCAAGNDDRLFEPPQCPHGTYDVERCAEGGHDQ